MKSEKGITLIALVITIIVMLILVTVTITAAVNGGLFDYAKNASTATNEQKEKENELGSGKVTVEGSGLPANSDINAIVDHYTGQ